MGLYLIVFRKHVVLVGTLISAFGLPFCQSYHQLSSLLVFVTYSFIMS